LFGYGVFVSLVLVGVIPGLALVVTYVIGVFFNYATTQGFVFRSKGWEAFNKFVVAYVVIYFFNLALFSGIGVLVDSPLLTQALSLPVVAIFSFLLFRLVVFRKSHENH
jgi:putative flippase GtrA